MQTQKRQFKILFTISFLFTALLIVFGLFFRQFVYWKSSEMILDSSKQYFNHIQQELTKDYQLARETVTQSIHIIGRTPITSATTLEERLDYVPMLYAALKQEENLSGLQIGYNSGDYFIVRPANNAYFKQQFDAPDSTVAIVDNISSVNGSKYLQRIYFDYELKEIKRNKPERTKYDPRVRPWYKNALNSKEEISSKPYLFHFVQQMGLTISYHPPNSDSVIGGDVTLYHLSKTIAKHTISPRTELVAIEKKDGAFLVAAYKDPSKLFVEEGALKTRADIDDLDSEILSYISKQNKFLQPFYEVTINDEVWLGSTIKFDSMQGDDFYLVTVSPEDEILHEAREQQQQTSKYTGLMILIAIPFIWLLAKRISIPLQMLAKDTEKISQFQFNKEHDFKGSSIKEVHTLGQAIDTMEWTIEHFINLTTILANEQNLDKLLKRISQETMQIGNADGVFTYLIDEKHEHIFPGFLEVKDHPECRKNVLPTLNLKEKHKLISILNSGSRSNCNWEELFPAIHHSDKHDLGGSSVILFPLWTRNKEAIGLLGLLFKSERENVTPEQTGLLTLLDSLSGFAAVTLESRQMLQMQKDLLESFIKLIAGAIDSKSPYTGGHCQRVPVLTKLLAQKACESDNEIFADFDLSEKEWEALHIASWLHDCGKVTTPEYVVDKSTKLETIYDRIHEVRMRFELLKREAHIRYFEEMAKGGDKEALQQKLEQEWQQIDDDFQFIAECNIGGEFMAEDKVARLQKIATRTWTRTISDRLGISWEEQRRKERTTEAELPTTEHVLADLPEHIIERKADDTYETINEFGFKLNTPQHKYNKGELYNLSIARGTLTEEERFKINDHIVQTIVMLKKLPFPKHLEQVPDIAGSHHEKLDGTGYPRSLRGEEMSLTAKMMVIADIFEALTASDRPYKKSKKLSEVIKIMGFMEKDKHIDSDLFKLFLSSGVYREYAEEYLKQEQIDEVDISVYCS